MNDSRQLVPLAVAERATTTVWNVIRVGPRTVLVAVALAAVTVGIAMNWSALVAAGIAPLLISALPCAVMCALGLCMSRMGRRSCATDTATQQSVAAPPDRLQLNSVPERSGGRELSADLADPSDSEAVGADQLQQQERRPTHA